uniref:Uncharacterized protein n=1 Tax=Anopheles melas TaxID=34690 RepID=A0A182UA56_9DIPT
MVQLQQGMFVHTNHANHWLLPAVPFTVVIIIASLLDGREDPTNFLAGKRDSSGSSWNALAKVLRHVCPRMGDSFCRRPQAHPAQRVDACASSGLPRGGLGVR